jgi:hypothetical protein
MSCQYLPAKRKIGITRAEVTKCHKRRCCAPQGFDTDYNGTHEGSETDYDATYCI